MRPRTVALYAVLVLLFTTSAHASGDPAVLYWMAAGGLTQAALLLLVLVARRFRAARAPSATAYLLYLVILWSWIWNSSQSPTLLGLALVAFPLLSVGTLLWILSAVAGAREESSH